MYCIYEPLSPASSVLSRISEAGSRASSVKKYKGMYCIYEPLSLASSVPSQISEAGSRANSVKKYKGTFCIYKPLSSASHVSLQRLAVELAVLTLKVPITTAADDKFNEIFPNF